MSEQERAELWRQQQDARDQWARDNAQRVAGSETAAATNLANWQPLIDALRDRQRSEPILPEEHNRSRWDPA